MKMWAGRFQKEEDKRVNDFNSSIRIDSRMFEEDINGSIAHATMLAKQSIIEESEKDLIVKTLEEIKLDLMNHSLEIDPDAEDIHMFVEAELTKRIHTTGKRLHTARSRNDQVALDTRMYVKKLSAEVEKLCKEFILCLCDKASENTESIMPGYTHMQRAQPITFAHHLMAYAEMFERDIERLHDAYKRCDVMPLGCGALATTTYPLDRNYTKELLGFSKISMNSLDGVSDRDFCIEYASALSLIMMHLSRFSEEVILWCSWEFKFVELDDAFSTGSSIMPQKKNPDICELIRGKSGRVFGDLQGLLTMMKGLPLAYNKDMQEDKEFVFDAFDTVKLCLTTIIPMVETMKVNKDNMRKAAAKGFINATDCADYLVKKGLAFREAYKMVGELVHVCMSKDKTLETLDLSDYKEICSVFEEDVYEAISLDTCVKMRKVIGGPSPEIVSEHIQMVQSKWKGE